MIQEESSHLNLCLLNHSVFTGSRIRMRTFWGHFSAYDTGVVYFGEEGQRSSSVIITSQPGQRYRHGFSLTNVDHLAKELSAVSTVELSAPANTLLSLEGHRKAHTLPA